MWSSFLILQKRKLRPSAINYTFPMLIDHLLRNSSSILHPKSTSIPDKNLPERGGAQTLPSILFCWWAVSMDRKDLFILNTYALGHWFLSLRTKQKSIISLMNYRPWNILNFYRFLPSLGLRFHLLFDRSSVYKVSGT